MTLLLRTLVVFVVLEAVLLVALWWFRRNTEGAEWRLGRELAWTVLPAALLALLAAPILIS